MTCALETETLNKNWSTLQIGKNEKHCHKCVTIHVQIDGLINESLYQLHMLNLPCASHSNSGAARH